MKNKQIENQGLGLGMENEDFVRNSTCCKKLNPPKQHSQLTGHCDLIK